MTRFLIDTNCVLYALSGAYPGLITRLAECEPGEAAISAISFAELILGTASGRSPEPDLLEHFPNLLEHFIAAVPILPFDDAAARAYAELPFRRARFDRLIAAHAVSLDAVIVTNNAIDFADVPGLRIENWTQP